LILVLGIANPVQISSDYNLFNYQCFSF